MPGKLDSVPIDQRDVLILLMEQAAVMHPAMRVFLGILDEAFSK